MRSEGEGEGEGEGEVEGYRDVGGALVERVIDGWGVVALPPSPRTPYPLSPLTYPHSSAEVAPGKRVVENSKTSRHCWHEALPSASMSK